MHLLWNSVGYWICLLLADLRGWMTNNTSPVGRVLINIMWLSSSPDFRLCGVKKGLSDHCPLFLESAVTNCNGLGFITFLDNWWQDIVRDILDHLDNCIASLSIFSEVPYDAPCYRLTISAAYLTQLLDIWKLLLPLKKSNQLFDLMAVIKPLLQMGISLLSSKLLGDSLWPDIIRRMNFGRWWDHNSLLSTASDEAVQSLKKKNQSGFLFKNRLWKGLCLTKLEVSHDGPRAEMAWLDLGMSLCCKNISVDQWVSSRFLFIICSCIRVGLGNGKFWTNTWD